MNRRFLPLLLTLTLCLALAGLAFGATDEALVAADKLNSLGMFGGVGSNEDGTPNYDLDRTPTRVEAVILMLRLLGKEAEASTLNLSMPFTDVDEWASPYIAYAYANSLTGGISETEFGSTNPVSATQYLSFVLRALGYTTGDDFQWDKAWELTDELGITSGEYVDAVDFTRGDAVLISVKALDATLKGSEQTLLQVIQGVKTDDPTPEISKGASIDDSDVVKRLVMLGDTYYDYAEEFKNGYAFAILGNDCGYIDTKGKFTVCYQLDSFEAEDAFNEVYMDVGALQALGSGSDFAMSAEGIYPYFDQETLAWGYADIHTGKTVITPNYSDAFPFFEGRAIVYQWLLSDSEEAASDDEASEEASDDMDMQREVWVIDTNGEKLFQISDTLEPHYQDSLLQAVVEIDGNEHICLLDLDGKVVQDLGEVYGFWQDESIHALSFAGEGFAMRTVGFNDDDTKHIAVGIADADGALVDFYYIDNTGKITARLPEEALWGWNWGKDATVSFYILEEGMCGLFGEKGKLTEPIFASFYTMHNGVAMVTEDGENWYLIGEDGKRIGSESFTYPGYCRDNGLIPAGTDGLCGYIDLEGNIAIDFIYEETYPFSNGVGFAVKEDSEYLTLLNTKGEDITGDFEVTGIYTVEEGFYLLPTTQGYCHVAAEYQAVSP